MQETQTDVKAARYAKGRRPAFFADPAMDEAMSMIMVLASELSVIRDRLDTYDWLLDQKGVVTRADVEGFVPDEERLAHRETDRQALLQRLFFVANKRAAELATHDSSERYNEVLQATAAE